MTFFYRLVSVLRWLVNRRRAEQGLDDELQAFIDMAAAEKMRSGLPLAHARRLAMLELGGIEQAKERVRTSRHGLWLDEIGRDMRYAFRVVVKNPGFAVIVVLTLALGIGINATLFSVVDGVLLQPLPFLEPDRLVLLNETFQRGGVQRGAVSFENLREWKTRSTSFSALAATSGRSFALSDGGGEPERVQGQTIAWNMFPLLGVPPQLGRHFGPDDDRPGAEPVVMLSDELWTRRYHADPSIIGGVVSVSGQPHTVVGIMPPGFAFPGVSKAWIPLVPIAEQDPRVRNLMVVGRLAPNSDLARARADMNGVAERVSKEFPLTNDGRGVVARPLAEFFIPDDVRLMLWTMMGAVTLVLLIACANVASLMMARASARQREFAVRAAIGAGRARLARQLLAECVMLGLVAAPLGLALASVGVWLIDGVVPRDAIPYTVHWEVSPRVVLYTALVSAATGIVFGLAPAAQAGQLNLVDSLRDGARGSGSSSRRARVRHGLVVVEVALALVLLVGASLFIRSFLHLKGSDPGFDTSSILTLRFYMTGDAYATDEQRRQRVEDIVRRVESLPSVQAAFASNFIPIDGGGGDARFGGGQAGAPSIMIDGRAVSAGEEPTIGFTAVTPHLYRALGLPVIRGRDFTDGEGWSRTPVAVIDQTMANKWWPSGDPVGSRFRLAHLDPPEWFTIIGIAPDLHLDDMNSSTPPQPVAYVPYLYGATANTGLTIRTAGHPAALAGAVRTEIRASDPGIPVFDIRTMEELRLLSFWQYGLFGWMFGIFGAAALFLAAIGVYGLLSSLVSQRAEEMGVRMALGAGRGDVLRLVVGQGLSLAALGIMVGLVGAFGVTRVIRTMLYNVTPTDPVSFGGVALFLVAVAFVASFVPARRATAVDPIVTLRSH